LDIVPSVAVIVAVVVDLTALVLTMKVAEVLPAGMVTVLESVADVELLKSETVVPPAGAIDEIVTVPVLVLPPLTLVGFRVSAVSVGAVIVTVADRVAPLKLAEMVAIA